MFTPREQRCGAPANVLGLVLGLVILTSGCFAHAAVLFDFDSGTNPPFVHQPIPLDYTADGLTAHFSSPDGSTWSVQNYDQTFFPLVMMSGNYLWPSDVFRHHLQISFSEPLTDISFTFATVELQDQVEIPSHIRMTAYSGGALVGSTLAQGAWVGAYPQGILTYSSADPFNKVDIDVPFVANGATNFVLDNVNATAAVPEPGAGLLFALIAVGILLGPGLRPVARPFKLRIGSHSEEARRWS